jgi:polyadenylation factor subunit 2
LSHSELAGIRVKASCWTRLHLGLDWEGKMAPIATANHAGPSSEGDVDLKFTQKATAVKQISKQRWAPTRYRTEPPAPPIVDHRLEEEAAAHQAAQEAGYEGRRVRKFLQRRTVDWNESMNRWKLDRALKTGVRQDYVVRPGVNHVVELLPSAAYRTSAQAVTTNLVHSSTNKIRCPVNIVRWTPEGRRLLTGSSSGEFTLWNGLTFNFETILQAHDNAIRAIEYTNSGAWILSADQGGVIKYFQSNMNNLQILTAHREAVRDLSFSPDDGKFVSASDDSTMKIWAFEEAREEKSLKGHGWDVKCVDWHPYKGLIVSGSKDNLVKFWDPRSGGNLATYHGHKGTVQAVQWSKDGNLVATASRDQMIKLYDIRAMAELATLKGHPNDVCSIDWHPDHRDLLVSGGSEGSVYFWSLNSADPGTPVHSMPTAHDSNVWSMAWHPLGHVLASGSNDHTTRFWQRARPEDGRLVKEGKETEAQQANKAERWNRAAKGEDWEGDNVSIPGLGGARRANNTNQNNQTAAPRMPDNDHFSIPGLGRGGGAGSFNGYGNVPPPRSDFVPPPRENYVPPPRNDFVPPPREEYGGGGNGGMPSYRAQRMGQGRGNGNGNWAQSGQGGGGYRR